MSGLQVTTHSQPSTRISNVRPSPTLWAHGLISTSHVSRAASREMKPRQADWWTLTPVQQHTVCRDVQLYERLWKYRGKEKSREWLLAADTRRDHLQERRTALKALSPGSASQRSSEMGNMSNRYRVTERALAGREAAVMNERTPWRKTGL